MSNEAERWKAEYRSCVEEHDALSREWSAMRRALLEILRGVLNACLGWSDEIDEEIEVLRIRLEQASRAEQLEELQRATNRICSALLAQQRAARDTNGGEALPDLATELSAIEARFVDRLAAEPLLHAAVDDVLGDASVDDGAARLDTLAGALVDAFGELSAQKAEAERFVNEVRSTLASLESWAADGASRVDAQRLAHQGLHEDVDQQVSALQQHVEGSEDIDDLKQSLRERFSKIAERMRAFRDSEEQKLAAVERQNAQLNGELAELQVRTEALHEQLQQQQRLLLLDTLTQVHSRFAYERRLDEEIAVCIRSGKPLCYSLWDIDYFKRINDDHGHHAGDEVLRRVAGYLSRYTRSNDFVARIGGEEFVVLFPDTGLDDATMIAEKLRALIAAAAFMVGEVPLSVTVSCGLDALRPGDDAEQLYRRADKALYEAKAAGRNRCIAA